MALGRPPPWRARGSGAAGCLAAALLFCLLAVLACAADLVDSAARLEDWVTFSSVADALQLRVPEPPPLRVTVNLVLIGFDNVTTASVAPAELLLADHLESLEPSQRHRYLFVRPDGTAEPTRPATKSTLTYQYWYGSKGTRGNDDDIQATADVPHLFSCGFRPRFCVVNMGPEVAEVVETAIATVMRPDASSDGFTDFQVRLKGNQRER